MISARIPANESGRLEALRALDLLDGPSRATFDAITRAAALVCDTPIALLSLVDSDRQWFLANVGLDATETSREVSF